MLVSLISQPQQSWVGMTDTNEDFIFLNLKYPTDRIELSFPHELLHLIGKNQGMKFNNAKSYDHLKLHAKAVCMVDDVKK